MRLLPLLGLVTVTLLLAGCDPQAERSAHDLFLYGDDPVRLTHFYGTGGDLAYSGRVIALEDAPASDERRRAEWSVRNALLVEGATHLRAELPALTEPPATADRIPLTTDMQLSVFQDVGEVVYFDGSSYLTLTPDGSPGVSTRVVPRPRLNRLRGIGQMTSDEADALAAQLEGRGPFVLVELPEDALPAHAVDGLADQRRTGVFVQHEIATDDSAYRPAPDQIPWETVASGAQATGVAEQTFQMLTDRQSLVSLWSRVHATQLSPPPVPEADFGRETLVAIFQGQQSSGGYSVQVRRVTVELGELYIDVEMVTPGPGTLSTQALTSPWALVRVLRGGFSVAWVRDASDGTLIGVARRPG